MRVSALRRSSFVLFVPRVGHVCEAPVWSALSPPPCKFPSSQGEAGVARSVTVQQARAVTPYPTEAGDPYA